jgi:hypothetical protein
MLEGGVSRQDRVVRLDNRVGDGRSRIHAELELRLLAVVSGEPLENKGTETRASSTTERVEDEEALKATAVIREAANLVHHSVNHLFADSVVAAGV